jgi:hypothetical protein
MKAGYPLAEKIRLLSVLHTKIKLKCIKDLNIRPETIKLLEKIEK